MPLTATAIRNAKPGAKTKRMFDGQGPYLEVAPSGGKWWRFKFRFGGKEKQLSLGVYPEISLKAAREQRDEARKLLACGIDPGENRKAKRAAGAERSGNSFEAVAREWFAQKSPSWSPSHADRIMRRLERDVFPRVGHQPISEIAAPQLLDVVRRIEQRGALETAHRALSNCGQVFRYAIATGRAKVDPSRDLRDALAPVNSRHFASMTDDPKAAARVLRELDGCEGTPIVHSALRLAPLVFVRPGEPREPNRIARGARRSPAPFPSRCETGTIGP